MICSCCHKDRDEQLVARVGRRDDVAICRDCLEYLLGKVGVSSTPIFPVLDVTKAAAFYRTAGFGVRIYDESDHEEPDFAFVDLAGQSVFDLGLEPRIDPATNRAGCFLVSNDVDDWHARLSAAGLSVTPVRDEPWGMREFTLTDPSGNRIRIGHAAG